MPAPTSTSGDSLPLPALLPAGPLISRRQALAGMALAFGASGAASAAHAAMVAPWDLRVSRVRVPIRGLPGALDGLRVVQVSDTHLGPHVPAWAIRAAIDLTLSLNPDLIALTGDYVDRADDHAEPAAELFRPLVSAPGCAGVVAVMGNHDWYGDGARVRAALERVGVRVIDNDRVFLGARDRGLHAREPAAPSLCVAGLADLEMDSPDVARALAGVSHRTPRVLLAHNPDAAERPDVVSPAAPRVDLMLSGHTHGGQIRLPLIGPLRVPSAYGDKYTGGVVRGPAFPVVVSRGVGMSVLPIRLNCPPEIVEITLVAA